MIGLDALGQLPDTFTYGDARRHGLSDRRLYQLRDEGDIDQIGRGLYRKADVEQLPDADLVEIAWRAPHATLCLTSALARHGLTDLIPGAVDVALPRGQRAPSTRTPVSWHYFGAGNFGIGRDELRLDDGLTIGIYTPQRCIVDAIRLRHREGDDLAYTALRRWLARGDAQPSELLAVAGKFPHAMPALRTAMQILL